MAAKPRYIEIVGWKTHQHYRNRDPIWIKAYTRLMADDDWLSLSLARRGLLLGLWLMYGQSGGTLRADLTQINSRLGAGAKQADLEALRDAGFIRFRASKPLATRYQDASLEVEKRREDSPLPPQSGGIEISSRAKGTNPRAVAEREQAARRAKFICPNCGLQTKGERSLREHLDNVHGGHVVDAGKVEAAQELLRQLKQGVRSV